MQVKLRPESRQDVYDAARFYDRQSTGCDMNEKVDANELPHSRVEDTDEDQTLSRAEFQKFYNSVISRFPWSASDR